MSATPPPVREPLSDPYTLLSVRSVPAPHDAIGTRWHRYEISQGINRIVGYAQGGLESVTHAAETMVARLNERRLHVPGRVHLRLDSKPSGDPRRR